MGSFGVRISLTGQSSLPTACSYAVFPDGTARVLRPFEPSARRSWAPGNWGLCRGPPAGQTGWSPVCVSKPSPHGLIIQWWDASITSKFDARGQTLTSNFDVVGQIYSNILHYPF